MTDKISIIVPVYRVEQYVERCMESILAQTYQNWEAILIEDGSPDKSGEICDRYAKEDKRIRVIHKANEGVSAARNTGIEQATGTFLAFIDSDDYVHPQYLEKMAELQKKYDADLVITGYELAHGTKIGSAIPAGEAEQLSSRQAVERIIENQQFCSPWSKLYRRELFAQIRYPKGVIYEDLMTAFSIFSQAEHIVYQNIPLYYYFQDSESITRSAFHYGKLDEAKALEKQYLFMKEHYPELEAQAREKYLYNVYGHILCLVKCGDTFGEEKYYEFCKIMQQNMSFFQSHRRLDTKQKYRCFLIKHPKLYRMLYKLTKKV